MRASAPRRRPDASAAFELLLGVPTVLSSLLVMALLGQWLTPRATWLIPVVWLLSGALVFLPAMDRVLAYAIFRLRRPSPSEAAALEPLWETVCDAAGVQARQYSLWVENSYEVNALAAGGRVVAVSTAAFGLPREHLEAVLAHELGHHLAGHTAVSLLRWWYELPARLVVLLLTVVASVVLAIGRAFLRVGNLMVTFVCVAAAVVLGIGALLASPWLLLVPVIAPLLALTSRRAELHADRVAAELGYGPRLLEVLERWVGEGHDEVRARAGLRARMLASHPSCAQRISRLREAM